MAEKNVPALTRTDEQLDDKIGVYSLQLDELWFDLNVDLLHNALGITLKDLAHPFVSPPAGDLVMDFLNNLGYPEELQFISKMHVNNLYQSWRTQLSMINQCLTDDYQLDNIKFVNKGGVDEVFGMHIPKDLITDAIRNSESCMKYLDMAARKPCQPTSVTDEEGG
ncbi:hypothetical protein Tco_1547564 [Tanacetum coccineum]